MRLILSFFIVLSGFSAHATWGHEYSATDKKIVYTGRTLINPDSSVSLFWPGSTIQFHAPQKEIILWIKDYGIGDSAHTNFLEVIVNGKVHSTIQLHPDTLNYHLLGLPNKKNHVILHKRTEASVGAISLKLLSCEDSLFNPLPAPKRKIEWVGNSLTCGYGNMVSIAGPPQGNPTTGFTSKNENNYLTWGAITSRHFNSNYVGTAFSGLGVYRNYGDQRQGTLPHLYDLINPMDTLGPKWNHNKYKPQLIVVKLGTNDFGPETQKPPLMTDSVKFVRTYIQFLKHLHEVQPQAKILVVSGAFLTDWYPYGLKRGTRSKSYIAAVVQNMKKTMGNTITHFHLQTQTPPYGEDWHPTVATHKRMSQQVIPQIQKLMGW